MNNQTKAQRLAIDLEDSCLFVGNEAAAELRRLDARNAELVRALNRLVKRDEADGVAYTGDHPITQAKAALTKAKEQT